MGMLTELSPQTEKNSVVFNNYQIQTIICVGVGVKKENEWLCRTLNINQSFNVILI